MVDGITTSSDDLEMTLMPFGKYRGMTFLDVLHENPGYFAWLKDIIEDEDQQCSWRQSFKDAVLAINDRYQETINSNRRHRCMF